MRKNEFGHLLSGTMLALVVATPIYAAAGPDQIDSAARPVMPAAITPVTGSVGIPAVVEAHPDSIDTQIAGKLRAVITSGQFDKRIDRAPEREAMAAFYAARNYAPLWIADGRLDARAKAVIAQLVNAEADGLNPADYQVPAFGAVSGAEALADAGSPVLRCHEPGAPAFPCNALVEGRTCPLDIGFDVVATVRARAGGAPAQSEFGVVCGVRAGVPLVVAGLAADRPFGSWAAATVEQGGDLVSTCRAVAEQCAVDQAIATHHVPEGAHS